jgi:tRNA(fMet)-specific endonuclease VapC
MNQYMLDTDIVIYTMKRKPPGVKQMFNVHAGEVCISVVTLGELYFGAENSSSPQHNMHVVEGFAARMNVLDYGRGAARQFGQLKRELKGKLIGAYDLMIAAHARSLGLILVTNNVIEFERVPGLRIENWVT